MGGDFEGEGEVGKRWSCVGPPLRVQTQLRACPLVVELNLVNVSTLGQTSDPS